MHIQINLNGDETEEQLARVHKMIGAYHGVSNKSATVDLELRVDGGAALLELERLKAAAGDLKLPESVGEKLNAELLSNLEAENPQFGRQPLPPGADPYLAAIDANNASVDLSAFPPGSFIVPGSNPPEVHHGPLAPSAAPSPAAAKASASAPAATPASIPPPPSAANAVPSPPPAAATPSPAGAAEVDKNGLPWDERIHAGSRAKIADGSWRMKRGVPEQLVAEVEAELRAQLPLAAPPVTFAEAPANGAPVPPPPAAPAPLPPGPPALTFGTVASRIGKAVTAGTLSGNVLSVKLAELGFPDGLHTVNARPDMWQKILDTLGA